MAGGLTDQGFSDQTLCNRLIALIGERFRYVWAWQLWFERIGQYWSAQAAALRLREAYVDFLAALTPEDGFTVKQRLKAAHADSQRRCLWLLSMDTRLFATPEEIGPSLKALPADFLMRVRACQGDTSEGLLAWDLSLRQPPGTLAGFFESAETRMRACHEKIPRVLVRTDHKVPDLAELWEDAGLIFGETAVSLDWEYWRRFPGGVTPAAALTLSGARVVFLRGLENSGFGKGGKQFPQWAVHSLARMDEVHWEGKDSQWHLLRVPPLFVLCGPPVPLNIWEIETRPHLIRCGTVPEDRHARSRDAGTLGNSDETPEGD
jgi:hypothetical protein